MGLETGTYVNDLNTANPTSTDPKSQGDDHLRLIKSVLKNTFAGFPGLVVATGVEAQGATANDYTVTLSPAPAAYTANFFVGFKTTHANTGAATLQVGSLGTKSLVSVDGQALISGALKNGSLAIAWYDGTQFYLVSANDRSHRDGDTYAGTHDFSSVADIRVPTKAQGDNSTNAASTAYVDGSFAPLASPALTGTPTAPTAAPGTNTAQLATTAFVVATSFNATLPGQAGNAGKFVTTDGTNASWADVPQFPLTALSVI